MPATSSHLPLPLLLVLVAAAAAAPAPVRYDQRQEGDFNVHAHLENFVVVLIPTAGSGSGGGLGIVDLLKKAGAHVRTADQPVQQDRQSPTGTPQDQHNVASEASEVAVVEVQPEAEQPREDVLQQEPQQREEEDDLQPAGAEALESVLVAESPALVVAKADGGHRGAQPEAAAAVKEASPQRSARAMLQAAERCPHGQFRDATGVCHYVGSDQRIGEQFFIGLEPPLEK